MKNVAISGAMLMLLAATAAAGELAVSDSTLGNMGLGSMQLMSDHDGLAIRGKGTFANVAGTSKAVFGNSSSGWGSWGTPTNGATATSQNSYEAGAQWLGKDSGAVGQSLSFAGQVEVLYGADPTGFALQVHAVGGIAGGGASASAH